MYAKVTFSQGLPENAHTVVLSFGDPAGRLDRDFWARDIECRNLTASEVVEGRELTAREAVRSEDFVSGFAGRGFRILEDGTGEMRRLTLHEALEVPELRYNRITAAGGQLWVTSAGTVRTTTDNGNGTWTLAFKLEEGEAHEFDKGDILRAMYHTPTGFQTGIYRVTESVDMSSVRIVVVEGIDPQAAMTMVRTGNYSDATRQNSIYLDGHHGYERVLRGVDSPEIVPEHVVYQAGLLDGLTTESFGPLEGIGVYCGNLYATGSLRVKVNGEDKDVGTQFEVTAEGISSLATKSDALDGRLTTAESSITQQAGLIETKVSQSTFDEMGNRVSAAESSITQQADEIALRVTEDQCQSLIEQKVNSLELGVTTAELETVGIKIEGADKGVHVRADLFDVSATSGAKLMEASADGNRVTMRNVDISGSFSLGKLLGTSDGISWNDGDGTALAIGNALPVESGGSDILAYFKSKNGTALFVKGKTNMPGVLLCANITHETAQKRWGYYSLVNVKRVFSDGREGGDIFRCYHNINHGNYVAFAQAKTYTTRNWWKTNALVLDCTPDYVDVILVDIGNEASLAQGEFDLMIAGTNSQAGQ